MYRYIFFSFASTIFVRQWKARLAEKLRNKNSEAVFVIFLGSYVIQYDIFSIFFIFFLFFSFSIFLLLFAC